MRRLLRRSICGPILNLISTPDRKSIRASQCSLNYFFDKRRALVGASESIFLLNKICPSCVEGGVESREAKVILSGAVFCGALGAPAETS